MNGTRLAPGDGRIGAAEMPSGSAVLRAARILEAIVGSDDPATLAAICREVALPKATVYRILGTLEAVGYVAREPGSKMYRTGERLTALAGSVLMHSPARAARRAILEELAEQVGESCNLTVPQGSSVLYLDHVEVSWPLKVRFPPGTCMPMHASASGKLFLAAMARRARERFVRLTPLVGYTGRTRVDPTVLLGELEAIREQGHAVDCGEYLDAICGVAVPVRNATGVVAAAVAVQAPVERTSLDQVLDCLPEIRRAAEGMALTLQW